MRYGLVRTVPPAEEVISLPEARLHLRVDADDVTQDSLIDSLRKAARKYVEDTLGRTLTLSTWQLTLDRFYLPVGRDSWGWEDDHGYPYYDLGYNCSVIPLPRPPLLSVVSVRYVDTAGVLQTLAPAAYQADTTREPGRILPAYATVWPVPRIQPAAVTITFTAGYPTTADIPEGLKAAVRLLLAHWYEHREAAAETSLSELPLGVQALLGQHWHGSYV